MNIIPLRNAVKETPKPVVFTTADLKDSKKTTEGVYKIENSVSAIRAVVIGTSESFRVAIYASPLSIDGLVSEYKWVRCDDEVVQMGIIKKEVK